MSSSSSPTRASSGARRRVQCGIALLRLMLAQQRLARDQHTRYFFRLKLIRDGLCLYRCYVSLPGGSLQAIAPSYTGGSAGASLDRRSLSPQKLSLESVLKCSWSSAQSTCPGKVSVLALSIPLYPRSSSGASSHGTSLQRLRLAASLGHACQRYWRLQDAH